MAAVTGYCMKCKQMVEMKDPKPITFSNGKPAMQGTCPTCGTKVQKVVSKNAV